MTKKKTGFGKRIKELRDKEQLTQKELGKQINISESAVGMYEREEREPSFEILQKIADFFNVSLDFLLTGKEHTKENENLYFFDMEGLTKDEIEDIKQHIEYVKWKANQRGKENE